MNENRERHCLFCGARIVGVNTRDYFLRATLHPETTHHRIKHVCRACAEQFADAVEPAREQRHDRRPAGEENDDEPPGD